MGRERRELLLDMWVDIWMEGLVGLLREEGMGWVDGLHFGCGIEGYSMIGSELFAQERRGLYHTIDCSSLSRYYIMLLSLFSRKIGDTRSISINASLSIDPFLSSKTHARRDRNQTKTLYKSNNANRGRS